MLKLLVAVCLFTGVIYASECHLSTVEYQDTQVVTDPDLDKDLLPTKTAFGCVFPQKGTLVVIQNFQGDRPVSVLVIPMGAVLKVTGLVDDLPNVPRAQPLPNVTPNQSDYQRSKYV